MTARCKERVLAQIDAMYGGLDYEPEEKAHSITHTQRYKNVEQKHFN